MTATDARTLPFAHVLPISASLSPEGHLALGGLDTVALAAEYGTPLYVFDAATLQAQCRAYLDGFRAADPSTQVL